MIAVPLGICKYWYNPDFLSTVIGKIRHTSWHARQCHRPNCPYFHTPDYSPEFMPLRFNTPHNGPQVRYIRLICCKLRRVLASLPSTCSAEEVLDSRITMRCAPGRSDSAPSSTLARQTARPGDYDNYEKPNGAAQVHIPRTMPTPRHDGISLGDDTARVARRVLAGAHVASEGRRTLPPEVIPPAKLSGGSRARIRVNLRSRDTVSA
ncbi:uncharacterized protein C8Q71DRAFT_575745 [Rhodofomes roseus]|uniref:C3H1-type domain-containing protein n=1 Tax=Rhodofomes roseus TaxID=34475 RepID=A0ABQ8KJU2_9APHY|nr:uncharacterized protein C8Q71DRAFT_575745 [Rhodofomes roseus]KAH9838050.1 hypothetical protein C8Q71DRAFT_575745 [Rhodofomes roseus]